MDADTATLVASGALPMTNLRDDAGALSEYNPESRSTALSLNELHLTRIRLQLVIYFLTCGGSLTEKISEVRRGNRARTASIHVSRDTAPPNRSRSYGAKGGSS